MSRQSTKERKAKQNLFDIKFYESIQGGMCLALKVPFVTYYDFPFITYYDLPFIAYYESKDYQKPIKTNSVFNSNYREYKSNRNKNKNLSLKEYLDMIKPYLSDIINNHKKWEIQLTMPISFISFKV